MSDSPDERVDEHVVFFTTALGDPAAERYPSLRSAVGRVESLCNDDDVQDAKVFQLVAVPLAVRSYFRVEVEAAQPAPPTQQPQPTQQAQPSSAVRTERPTESPVRDEVPEPRQADPRDETPEQGELQEMPHQARAEERRPRDERRPMRDEVATDEGETAEHLVDADAERTRSLGFFVR